MTHIKLRRLVRGRWGTSLGATPSQSTRTLQLIVLDPLSVETRTWTGPDSDLCAEAARQLSRISAPSLSALAARCSSKARRSRTHVIGVRRSSRRTCPDGEWKIAPRIWFLIILSDNGTPRRFMLLMPTWPEQCDGTPTRSCSSRTITLDPMEVAVSATVAPATPQPTTMMSVVDFTEYACLGEVQPPRSGEKPGRWFRG